MSTPVLFAIPLVLLWLAYTFGLKPSFALPDPFAGERLVDTEMLRAIEAAERKRNAPPPKNVISPRIRFEVRRDAFYPGETTVDFFRR